MTNQSSNSATKGELAGKYLTFAVSRERYGFGILKVQEIIKVPHITTVPKCPTHIRGVINLRGKIIPVIDLRLKFGIEPAPYDDKTCIIVITVARGDQTLLLGVVVDTVLEVINFSSAEISESPNYGLNLDSQFIVGMGTRDEMLNILIDIDKVLTHDDGVDIAELSGSSGAGCR